MLPEINKQVILKASCDSSNPTFVTILNSNDTLNTSHVCLMVHFQNSFPHKMKLLDQYIEILFLMCFQTIHKVASPYLEMRLSTLDLAYGRVFLPTGLADLRFIG